MKKKVQPKKNKTLILLKNGACILQEWIYPHKNLKIK